MRHEFCVSLHSTLEPQSSVLLLLRATDGIRTHDNSLEGCCVTPTPLSHIGVRWSVIQNSNFELLLVGAARFELTTSRTQTERSTKLSYAPKRFSN